MPSWPNRNAFGITSRILPGELDGIETAIRTLFGQITDSKEWSKLLRVIGTLADDLEAVQVQVQDLTDPRTSTGVHLDWLGENVGRPRAGLADDDLYRIAVIARGYALIGSGVAADVLTVLKIVDPSTPDPVITEIWPAKLQVDMPSTTLDLTGLQVLAGAVRDVVADGVGIVSVGGGGDVVDNQAGTLSDAFVVDNVGGTLPSASLIAIAVFP